MEILNNIWLAISTPNEGLLNMLFIPIAFIENFLIITLYLVFLNTSVALKKKVIYSLLITFLGIFTQFFIPNPFNIFINYLLHIVIAYLMLKNLALKTVISIVLSIISFNLIGIFILNPFLTVFKITSEQLNSIPFYKVLYVFIVLVFTVLIITILKHKKLKLNFIDNIDKRNKIIIILNMLLGLLAIIIQSITLFYYVDKLPYTGKEESNIEYYILGVACIVILAGGIILIRKYVIK